MKIIQEAKSSLYLETFIFSHDEVGHLVLEALTAKSQEGVEVKILLDSLGAMMPGHPSFKKFKAAGGEISMFMPLIHKPFQGSANLRNHRKLVVADDQIAMIGGMNIALEYMGPTLSQDRWVDLAMTIEGPLVPQLKAVFLFDWSFAHHQESELKDPPRSKGVHDQHLAQLVMSGPDIKTDPIYELLLTALYSAKQRVWITSPYFIPDESLAKAIELAARRGVDVRLVVPKKSNHLLADFGRQTYLDQIHTAGAMIYYYPKMIHAKLTLVDDHYGFIGSANMDSRSLLLNYELGVCLYSSEDLKKLEKWCEMIFEMSSTEFRQLTSGQQWFGRVARLVSPLI
jgi:cardiolipin synthase